MFFEVFFFSLRVNEKTRSLFFWLLYGFRENVWEKEDKKKADGQVDGQVDEQS